MRASSYVELGLLPVGSGLGLCRGIGGCGPVLENHFHFEKNMYNDMENGIVLSRGL